MVRRASRAALAVAALVLCLLAPTAAWAAEEDEGAIAAFRLKASNGYRVAPFHGSATFRREAPRSNRWTGNLTVDLPGRADTPLTQPGFRLSLVHVSWTKSRGDSSRRSSLGRPLALLEAS